MGSAPPPVLERFLTEREFWRELGVSSGVLLEDMPWRLAEDYSLIIQLIRREEQARAGSRR